MSGGLEERFEWDEANVGHIARHGVVPGEAEEVLDGETLQLREMFVRGEQRIAEVGITRRFRFLIVVWTPAASRIRVVTAYPADKAALEQWMVQFGGRAQ